MVKIELDSVHYDRNICEVLQEIVETVRFERIDNDKLNDDLKTAMVMAKKMGVKLKTYKYDWDRGLWEKNVDYVTDILKRFPRWQFPYHYARYHIKGIIRGIMKL